VAFLWDIEKQLREFRGIKVSAKSGVEMFVEYLQSKRVAFASEMCVCG